jgi:ribose transport system permease protein
MFSRFMVDYGMIVVLGILVAVFSMLTIEDQQNVGAAAGAELAEKIKDADGPQTVVIVAPGDLGTLLIEELTEQLEGTEHKVIGRVQGTPADVLDQFKALEAAGDKATIVACTPQTARWGPVEKRDQHAAIAGSTVLTPDEYKWPTVLTRGNLLNIAQQISIIAIIAIGMTLVIVTAGIDLSVGSLIALAAVTSMMLVRDVAGAEEATVIGMILCGLAGVGACGLMGLISGFFVAALRLPAFIVTLAMMLMARGLAMMLTRAESINEVPDSFGWLGAGRTVGIPNSVILMFVLYGAAHFVMSRTKLGRHIYAIGGNEEAARLSGVPVQRVLLIVYTTCGLFAGLGGVLMASKHQGVEPNVGAMAELTVIAAVVVGGTSLMGGQGKVFGTLIGAFIIAVIKNGMNQVNVSSFAQDFVLGAVILGAVIADQWRKGQVNWQNVRGLFAR